MDIRLPMLKALSGAHPGRSHGTGFIMLDLYPRGAGRVHIGHVQIRALF